MPRTNFFGNPEQTGEDLALDSTVRALGGMNRMANYWAQYSDKIKAEEEKKREEQAKEEAQQLEEQEKLQNEYFQIKSLRNDLPDDVALYIAKLENGPYRQTLIKNIKQQQGFLSAVNELNPFASATPLNKLMSFYNQNGSVEPLNRMRAIINQGAEQTGRLPQEVVQAAVEQGLIDPQYGSMLYDTYGEHSPQETSAGLIGRKALETIPRAAIAGVESLANIPSLVYDIGRAITPRSTQFDPTGELREDFSPEEYERMKTAYESMTPEQIAETEQEIRKKVPTPYVDIKAGIRKFLPNAFPEPKSPGEKMYNDAIDTTGALLMGGGVRGATLAGKAGRALAAGAAGEIGKWGAQKAGASPLVAEGIKLGSMSVALLVGKEEAKKLASGIYNSITGNPQSEAALIPRRQTNNLIGEVNKLQRSGKFTPDTKTKALLDNLEKKAIGSSKDWSRFNKSLGSDILLQENRIARQQLKEPIMRVINELERKGPKNISKIKEAVSEINSNWNKLVYEGKFTPSQETAQIFGNIRSSQQLSLNDIVNLEKTLNNFYPKADSRDIAAIKELKDGPIKDMFNYISNSGPKNAALVREVDKAKQLYAASQEVGKVSKVFEKIMGKPSVGRSMMYGLFGGSIPAGAAIAGGTYGSQQAVRLMEQFIRNLRNPEMRRVLGNTVINAMKGKAVQSGKELKRLIEQEQDRRLNKLLKKK